MTPASPPEQWGLIWSAYAISAAVLVALVVESLLRTRRWRREAERLEAGGGRP